MQKMVGLNQQIVEYLDSIRCEMSYNEILCQLLGLPYSRHSKKLSTYEPIKKIGIGESTSCKIRDKYTYEAMLRVVSYQKKEYNKDFEVSPIDARIGLYNITRTK